MKRVLRIVVPLAVPCLVAGIVLYFFWWNRSKSDNIFPPITWFEGEVVANFTVTSWKESGKEKAAARVDIVFKKPGSYRLEKWSERDKGGTLLGDLSIEVSESDIPKHVQQENLEGRLELYKMVKAQGGRRSGKSGSLEKGERVVQPIPAVNVQYMLMDKLTG